MKIRSEAELPNALPRAFQFGSPLPDAPVEVKADDPENWERYPIGLPHIVAMRDEDDRTLYSLRIRDLTGRLIPIRGETTDLELVRRESVQVLGQLIGARRFEPDAEEAEEIAEAQFLLRASWELPFREGRAGHGRSPWEPIPIEAFDYGDYARFPLCFPFVLQIRGRFGQANYCIAWRASASSIAHVHTYDEDYEVALRAVQMRLVRWLCICQNRGSVVLYGDHERPELGPKPGIRPF
ncbi:hypothetical protein [Methylobacterium symbioticum]|mgnify:CR=1 FL=1|uniref:Uncharacterized protein n=1 Tax=Methylobacterium symbioticum TaxID=2584084 RepID=A0A509E7A1_9HYPH|nr:hypothetical protein [Methylobacterium symbioticum]VUD70166.1 hypothetical protein MET9862_00729 [Methylobacterium symbioticum]